MLSVMNYDCNQRAARSFLSVTMFSINTLSCRLLPINTCSSALALCPKGRESPDTFIPLCLGASGGLPATFRSPSPPLLIYPAVSCTDYSHLLAKDAHRLWYQDSMFPAQPCWVQRGKAYCTPPRSPPPSFPCQGHSQGTARVLVPFKEDMFCTQCAACTRCPAFQLVFEAVAPISSLGSWEA